MSFPLLTKDVFIIQFEVQYFAALKMRGSLARISSPTYKRLKGTDQLAITRITLTTL
jgi:hypothetical protein